MAAVRASKNSTPTKAEFIARLNTLAEQLAQIGLTDEAFRAREIAREVRALPASAQLIPSGAVSRNGAASQWRELIIQARHAHARLPAGSQTVRADSLERKP